MAFSNAVVCLRRRCVYKWRLTGGLIGGGLDRALDTLGSVIVLLATGIISIVMATGKSFFHALGDANAHRKARRKVKNEKSRIKPSGFASRRSWKRSGRRKRRSAAEG